VCVRQVGNAAIKVEVCMSGRATTKAMAVTIGAVASLLGPLEAHAGGCRDQTPVSWDVEVAPASEPGTRLVVSGRVISRASGGPLPGVTVYVYHADVKGDYVLPGHEKEPPRLCGILRTNERGEYRIRTSMPGGYEGYLPHIHFEISGHGVHRQFTFVNLVRRVAVMDTSHTLILPGSAPAVREDTAGLTRPVYLGADGVLRCTRDLVVDAPPTLFDPPKPGRLGSER